MLTILRRPLRPPLLLPPVVLENLLCTNNFMTVIAALFTASCLPPDEAPPDLSKSLEASAIAILMSVDFESFSFFSGASEPDRKFLNTW